jgi:hypothetical protein
MPFKYLLAGAPATPKSRPATSGDARNSESAVESVFNRIDRRLKPGFDSTYAIFRENAIRDTRSGDARTPSISARAVTCATNGDFHPCKT